MRGTERGEFRVVWREVWLFGDGAGKKFEKSVSLLIVLTYFKMSIMFRFPNILDWTVFLLIIIEFKLNYHIESNDLKETE